MSTRLDDLVQLDYRWMTDQFQNVDLPGYTLYIGHIDYLLLYQDLDGDPLASQGMRT